MVCDIPVNEICTCIQINSLAGNAKIKVYIEHGIWWLPDDKGCGILDTQPADFHFARQIAWKKT